MRFASSLALAALVFSVSACDSGDTNGPPRTARITKVTILDAPLVDPDGAGWDGGSDGPEIYFRLFDDNIDYIQDPDRDRLNPRDDGSVDAVSSSDAWYDNVNAGSFPLVWDVDPGYTVRDLTDPLYIALYDRDGIGGGGDDPMAETSVFRLSTSAPSIVDDQPDVITLTSGLDRDGNPTNINVRITVVYED